VAELCDRSRDFACFMRRLIRQREIAPLRAMHGMTGNHSMAYCAAEDNQPKT
jgi:hypothetical protein